MLLTGVPEETMETYPKGQILFPVKSMVKLPLSLEEGFGPIGEFSTRGNCHHFTVFTLTYFHFVCMYVNMYVVEILVLSSFF